MTPTSERNTTRSQELYCSAKRLIAGGTQTISKQPERFVEGVYPAYVDHARGARVWDLDGHEYLDYVLALGPVVLGYCDPDVDRAAKRAIDQGILHSANNPTEVELAEELCRLVPCAEMVRFFKGGADACSAAVRIARFVTGRNRIVCCGYHGWHDWWAGKRGEPGVPKHVAELTHDLPYGDTAALKVLLDEHGSDVAAVFVETAVFDFDPEFLRDCRQECSRHGCLLIFDEIITGFRLALGGAQEVAGVVPDMATLGKAMANGYPIAAVVGRSEILREAAKLWISVTFGSEGASLAAALATLKKLEGERVIDHLTRLGTTLKLGWESIGREFPHSGLRIGGTGAIPALRIQDEKVETGLMREMISRGFLIRRGHYWFTAMMHTEADAARTLDAMREALLAVSPVLRGERA